ncbi:FCS-Like Zinc finger 14 isoform X2 [Cryptomeria japonica]|uniref:FCS-Like Zinc finger 14 isoform X2 n=1 Tax=Cryptomeria japonica TaxID=3369 RepID=UPI0027DA296A|nr:FCS-Like Zinc finger 14 isoform X2 [Cryptomeria japonica]
MAVKRPRPIQSKQNKSVLMFDSPSEIRSVFKYFRVLVGFRSGKCGGIPVVKDGCLSPTSPLDFKGSSRYSSGVGLGILVALDDNNSNEQSKPMPIVSVKLPSWSKSGRREENGGRLCSCTETVFEDSGSSGLSSFEPADFLYACYMCRRKLSHQKDIYIGDKAFCSEECRHQQIASDERKERRPSTSCSSSCSPIFTITPMPAALY